MGPAKKIKNKKMAQPPQCWWDMTYKHIQHAQILSQSCFTPLEKPPNLSSLQEGQGQVSWALSQHLSLLWACVPIMGPDSKSSVICWQYVMSMDSSPLLLPGSLPSVLHSSTVNLRFFLPQIRVSASSQGCYNYETRWRKPSPQHRAGQHLNTVLN